LVERRSALTPAEARR
jgi:hypothetical protein